MDTEISDNESVLTSSLTTTCPPITSSSTLPGYAAKIKLSEVRLQTMRINDKYLPYEDNLPRCTDNRRLVAKEPIAMTR